MYDISFTLYSTDAVPGNDANTIFGVRWDGTEISNRNITGASTGLDESFTRLIATTANTVLYFQSSLGNFVIFHLDNVFVTASAIPEPATYAALLGGVALGLAGWRRRRA